MESFAFGVQKFNTDLLILFLFLKLNYSIEKDDISFFGLIRSE